MRKIVLVLSLWFVMLIGYAQEQKIPKLFKLEWGSSFKDVDRQIITHDVGLSHLNYYMVAAGHDELHDLRTESLVRYKASGSPFFDIPSEIIFTFYNSSSTLDGLKLARVEVYLKKKYSDKSWINTKAVFKSLISFFCENYSITLKRNEESLVFSRYDYEVVVNGVYATFIADVGNRRLSQDDGIYFCYENNELKNLILKKDVELEKEKLKLTAPQQNEHAPVSVKDKL